MKFRVNITAPAKRDMSVAVAWIRQDAPDSAKMWYQRLRTAIESLSDFPMRCPLAPESQGYPEIRQLLSGKGHHVYRILFEVRGDFVYVLHVVHGARNPIRPDTDDELSY